MLYGSPMLRSFVGVDPGVAAAPSSTKNATGERDPEVHQTSKQPVVLRPQGAHRCGLEAGHGAHGMHDGSLGVGQAHAAHLPHGEETKVWGRWRLPRPSQSDPASCSQGGRHDLLSDQVQAGCGPVATKKNRTKSRVRARVEHPFLILKRVFGFDKVRYRGLAKNHHRLCANFALIHLYLHRKRLAMLAA